MTDVQSETAAEAAVVESTGSDADGAGEVEAAGVAVPISDEDREIAKRAPLGVPAFQADPGGRRTSEHLAAAG